MELFIRCLRDLERLEAQADVLDDRLDAFEPQSVLYLDDLELLIDPLELWKPPHVTVRRGTASAVVWLDADASVSESHGFSRFEERRVLALVQDHLDELSDQWYGMREDVRRGRLGRRLRVE